MSLILNLNLHTRRCIKAAGELQILPTRSKNCSTLSLSMMFKHDVLPQAQDWTVYSTTLIGRVSDLYL